MKKLWWLIFAVLMICGCTADPVYETMGNVWDNPQVQSEPASIEFGLPDDAQMEVMESDGLARSYRIGEWMLWTEICNGGDVEATMEALTGLEDPRIISHPAGVYTCYETAWAVGEEAGEFLVRTAVIPKGQYHYCLSIKYPQEDAVQVGSFFTEILNNVSLKNTDT